MKADWHLDRGKTPVETALAADTDEFDPFDEAECPVMFRPGTNQISPDAPDEELQERLALLLRREARLDAAGITCPIKDMHDVSCLACPFSKADDPESEKCGLCRVGVQQDLVATALVAKAHLAPAADVVT